MVLSLVFGCIPFMFFQPAFAAAERPSESEAERPPGMDAGIQPLAEFIAEKGAEETGAKEPAPEAEASAAPAAEPEQEGKSEPAETPEPDASKEEQDGEN